jgi:hypothetical protein
LPATDDVLHDDHSVSFARVGMRLFLARAGNLCHFLAILVSLLTLIMADSVSVFLVGKFREAQFPPGDDIQLLGVVLILLVSW